MTTPTIDGSLQPWEHVAAQHEWSALLVGNGLSINVWPPFAYGSLFDHAHREGLTAEDRKLFDGTRNFERALSDLTTAMRVGKVLKMNTAPVLERYRSIQVALGHAIRKVHPKRFSVPDDTLLTIRAAMLDYEWVFTTCYDLIVYWCRASSWAPGDRIPDVLRCHDASPWLPQPEGPVAALPPPADVPLLASEHRRILVFYQQNEERRRWRQSDT